MLFWVIYWIVWKNKAFLSTRNHLQINVWQNIEFQPSDAWSNIFDVWLLINAVQQYNTRKHLYFTSCYVSSWWNVLILTYLLVLLMIIFTNSLWINWSACSIIPLGSVGVRTVWSPVKASLEGTEAVGWLVSIFHYCLMLESLISE